MKTRQQRISERREQQNKMGQDAANAMYAAGEHPLVIIQRARDGRHMSEWYYLGMREAANRFEKSELGGVA